MPPPPPPRLCSRSKLTPDQPVLGVVKAGGRREGRKAFLSFSLLASTVTAWPRLEAAAAAVALVAAATMVAASLKNQARLVSQQLHQPVNQTGGRVGPHSGCLFLKIVKKLKLVFSL